MVSFRIDFGDLNSVLKGQQSQLQPRNFMYSQSVSTKTIRNADGVSLTNSINSPFYIWIILDN